MFRDNMLHILAGLALTVFLVRKVYNYLYNRQARKISGTLYAALKAELESKGPGMHGVSERDMLARYLSLPEIKGDKVKRDEQTFSSLILPNL